MHSDKPVLSTRAWLLETLGIALCMVAAIVLVNMYIDIYGIFRNAKGRHLPVYGDERIAKYLLSEKFVPENFDALLIGTSVSANWKTSDISDFRVYNESVDGGVIAEEKTIADNALLSSHIRLVLLLVQPYLTASDEFKTVQLTPRENVRHSDLRVCWMLTDQRSQSNFTGRNRSLMIRVHKTSVISR